MLLHLNRHFPLLRFRFGCLHIHSTPFSTSSQSYPVLQHLQLKRHQQYQRHLTCHCIIHLFPSGTYLPLGQFKMVVLCINTCQMDKKMFLHMMIHNLVLNYDSLSYHLSVWGISFLQALVEYHLSFPSVDRSNKCLLKLCWSRHSLTLPFALGTKTKLLHHADNSSTPNGFIVCCLYSLSSSSFRGPCKTYSTILGGTDIFNMQCECSTKSIYAWKTSLNSLLILFVNTLLAFCLLLCLNWI